MRHSILRQAATFHAVARTGSIAAAGRKIGKSAPAIHHDLKIMERALGRPLFVRVGRSLRLTPGAVELYESISRSLDDIKRATQRFQRGKEAGEVRIATVSGFGRYRLAARLFEESVPGSAIELIMGSHEYVLEALGSRRVDAAITYKPVSALPISATPFATEEYVFVAKAGTRLECTFQSVQDLNFITYDEYEYVFGRWFDTAFGQQPKHFSRLDHMTELEEALASVASGRGVTIVPADAWLHGPWFARCDNCFEGIVHSENTLFLLTLPGAEPTALEQLKALRL